MFGFSRQSVVFSPTQKRLLRELVIQEDSPGTILRDFEALPNYLFDFGDSWEFELTLENVDNDTVLDEPMVLETEGEPPEQYPQWEDWE